ncbi:MAG: tRNA (adenosine(37)-N6)-threonylcarbamoyltransferase complex dimerization subunit type 1 TsaB [Bacillota bacterium]
MRALAIDTSTAMAGIAVADEQGLLAGYSLMDMKTHSQKLVPMLHELLAHLGLAPADIDVFAAVTGPGSFTGLRIGVTTIKSLAYATGKRTAGIPSLDALAFAAAVSEDSIICPIMDARNNQVYAALYQSSNGTVQNLSGYMGVHISDLVRHIEERHNDAAVMFTGDGVLLHRDFLKIELNGRCSFMPDFMLRQMAAPAAQMAITMALRGDTTDSTELVPFYLRPSQAEREYMKKHGGGNACGGSGICHARE